MKLQQCADIGISIVISLDKSIMMLDTFQSFDYCGISLKPESIFKSLEPI